MTSKNISRETSSRQFGVHYIGRLVSFEVTSADLPTMLKEDRIKAYNFSKAWPHIRTQLTQRILYKRLYNLGHLAHPVASLWGIFSKATRPGSAFSNLRRSLRNHWRYKQCTDSTESLLTHCLQLSLLRRQ